jgi:hypothetical protein
MVTLLENELLKNIILPFILIFTLVFAILEKSKLLGEGKQQINAIISFVIAGILITFSTQVTWLQQFMVFLAIGLLILFVFLLMFGFVTGGKDDILKDYTFLKYLIGGIVFIAVVVAVLIITDTWGKISNFFTEEGTGQNIVFLIVIIGAVIAVLFGGGKSKEKKD